MSDWTRDASAYLRDRTACPRCGERMIGADGLCRHCSTDLGSTEAQAVLDLSLRIADDFDRRAELVAALPRRVAMAAAVAAPPSTPAPARSGVVDPTSTAGAPPGQPVPLGATASPALASVAPSGGIPAHGGGMLFAPPAAPPSSASPVSVQSLLAVAGATMVAIAAIVFTFFNPDLQVGVRTAITAGITAVFMAGALLLARTSLRLSAESVAALAVVFVGLDVWALAQQAPPSVDGWAFAAIGAAVGAVVLVGLAILSRLHAWMLCGLLLAASVPAMLGYATLRHPVLAGAGGYGEDATWTVVLGHLGALAVVIAALSLESRITRRLAPHPIERVVLGIVAAALVTTLLIESIPAPALGTVPQGIITGLLMLVLALAAAAISRVQLATAWSAVAGVLVVLAAAREATALDLGGPVTIWWVPLVVGAGAIGAVVVAAIPPLRAPRRSPLVIGAWMTLLIGGTPVGFAVIPMVILPERHLLGENTLAFPVALAEIALALAVMRVVGRAATRISSSLVPTALSLALVAAIAAGAADDISRGAEVGVSLAVAVACAVVLLRRRGALGLGLQLPLVLGMYLAIGHAALATWPDASITVVANVAVLAVLVLASRTAQASLRWVHTGAGFAYALIVLARGLALAQLLPIDIIAVTACAAAAVAIAVTYVRRVPTTSWLTVLAVTTVPTLIAIGSVIAERSPSTALSTALVLLLALALTTTAGRPVHAFVRTIAAFTIVPAFAVVVVCLGAQLPSSGSPIVLPVVAAAVAIVLPLTGWTGRRLEAHGIPPLDARWARLAIEVSCLVTASIDVLLALVRSAAGLGTSLLVLLILGFGAAITARLTHRTRYWAAAFTAWSGALWSFWALIGVDVVEPYVLPPALAVALVGAIALVRGRRVWMWLVMSGLLVALVPSMLVFALTGYGDDASGAWRGWGVLAASAVLLGLALVSRRVRRMHRLVLPFSVTALTAAAMSAVLGARFGLGLDPTHLLDEQLTVLVVLAIGLGGAVIAAGAALVALPLYGRGARWVLQPALGYLVAGAIITVFARRRADDWLPVVVMLVLLVLMLAAMIRIAWAARSGRTVLPPVWFVFALAWGVAVAAWAPRLLRVEAFSIPLGLALIATGAIALVPGAARAPRGLTSWPIGFERSWGSLAPGIVILFLPLVLATGTDPQTWRAIIVIALALAAVLIGSLQRLAAPFILGLTIMPLENVVVFAARIGPGIGATPWWITLATAGAVMIGLAVTYERRSAGGRGGVAARVRDLR